MMRNSTRTILIGLILLLAYAFLPTSTLLLAQTGPVTMNFELGNPGQLATGWYFNGSTPGYMAGLSTENPASGAMCMTLSRTSTTVPGDFGYLSQGFDATPFHGKRVRFRAAVRAQVAGSGNQAQLWLRVDRPNGQRGFFDNMGDRPITSPDWSYYEINGDVAADATQIVLGLILAGRGTAWIDDGSFQITALPDPVSEPPRPLTVRGLENVIAFTRLLGYVRHFHPSDEAALTDWDRFAIEGMRAVESAGDAAELARTLESLFYPVAPALQIFLTGNQAPANRPAPPPYPVGPLQMVMWRHEGFGTGSSQSAYHSTRVYTSITGTIPDELVPYQEPYQAELGGGVSCSVALALFADSNGTWPRGTRPVPTSYTYSARDRGTRMAAVALAWNVFQHFYPYFNVVNTDWPAALRSALSTAATDPDERAFLDTLRRLVAALHDGHGRVYNPSIPSPSYTLPFNWDWIQGQLVVTSALNQGQAPAAGDVVLRLNGKPAATALENVESLISGATPQWIRMRGLADLRYGNKDESLVLEVQPWASPGKTVQVTVSRDTLISNVKETRPSKIAELEPGIIYVDLNEVSDDDVVSALPQLEQAQGIIFDMRGYPGKLIPSTLFSHIIEQPVTSAWWNIPLVTFPDDKEPQFLVSRWNDIQPAEPFLKGKKAFITDGRAISYAESCMGIVEHYKLAEIVGGPTAGTNGNVNPFTVPGGYLIYWTGMKVLKHDGSQHHGIGILPTVPVSRTRAGAAAGVDELLQRAIQVVSPTSAVEVELTGEGAAAASTIGGGGPVQAGYAVAQVASGNNPYGVAVYSFKDGNGVVVSEAGVPASPPTTSARIFIDYRSGASPAGIDVNTGIALVNCGAAEAHVSYTLRNREGTTLVVGHGQISAGVHVSKLISQLSDLAPDAKFPDNFSADVQFGSLDIESDQPLSLIALRITLNQRKEMLLTTTRVVDLTKPAGGLPVYLPQFADGGGYLTTMILLNTSTVLETGTLALFGDDGTPLTLSEADGKSASKFGYSIQPGGAFRFQTSGSSENLVVGWLQVFPDPGTPGPAGAAVFSLLKEGILVAESGVPTASLTTHARIYVDHSDNRDTGLAIASPAGSGATVIFKAFEMDGSTPSGTALDPLNLLENGHAARFVSQLIDGLPAEFSGVLDISSPSPFVALTLQSLTNSRGDVLSTTFPIVDAGQPAPAPVVFPQIADGGGYLTRFVLLGAGAPSVAQLYFYDNDGKPLSVASSKGPVKF